MAKDDSGFSEIEEYTKKLTQNPESLVFVPLAESYRKSGMLDEAIETCLKGLQVHPTYMSARMVLGRAYMEKKMYEEAATEFHKVAAADVNNIMAHSLLGQIFTKQGKFTNAIEEYQKVLTLNPDDASAQQMLQLALEQAKQNGQARLEAQQSVGGASAPANDARKEINQAEGLVIQGDIDNALKIYRLIIEADPGNLVVRQRIKDLEQRKAQTSTERITGEKAKGETLGGHRDNDKITSDDILSVMKDTIPKGPERAPGAKKPEAAGSGLGRPDAKPEPKPESKPEPKPVPKPEPAAKPDPKPESKPQGQTEVSPEISAALGRLVQTTGIVGCLLITEDGRILHSSFADKGQLGDMAQTAALIFDKTGKAVRAMNYGTQIHQILITGETGQIFFTKFGNKILLVQADQNINIGKMRLAMSEVNKAMR